LVPEGVKNCLDELVVTKRLGEVVNNSKAHGLDRGFGAARVHEHHDRSARELVTTHADESESIHIPAMKIHDSQFRLVGTDSRHAIHVGVAAKDLMTGGLAELGHPLKDRGLVIDDCYPSHDSLRGWMVSMSYLAQNGPSNTILPMWQ
jgi:hypothetical protein